MHLATTSGRGFRSRSRIDLSRLASLVPFLQRAPAQDADFSGFGCPFLPRVLPDALVMAQ